MLSLEKLFEKAAAEAKEEIFGEKKKNERKDDKNAEQLENIYIKSLSRIFKIADKFSAGEFSDLKDISEDIIPTKILPKEGEQRNLFDIGDRVKIGCSYHAFKFVEKNVGTGWKKSMRNLHTQRGIVTDENSKYDTTVQVYFPDTYSSCTISTAVLQKDDSPEVSRHRSQWKIGDSVQTRTPKSLVKHFMKRLPDIPDQFIGQPGKVIAVTTAGVFVTFNGLRSYAIDSALIEKAEKECIIDISVQEHPRNFVPGEEVRVISKLRKLISNQKGKGGWNKDMCSMAGKKGIITDVNNDETVDVSCEFGRGWRMNSDSILHIGELEPEEEVEELEFLPGDKVKVAMTDDVRMHLISKNIPLMFLEYLLVTGEVNAIDDDLNAWTRFNSTSRVRMQMSSLTKATKAEIENFEKIQEKLANLKLGDDVYIDVGPPNYVKAVLAKSNINEDVARALTTTSKIVGWTDVQHAVIQYENSKSRYRINKKYLTVPERFNVRDAGTDEFRLKSVEEMETAIADCVQKLHVEDVSEVLKKDFAVEVYSFLNGQPPVVEFRVRSTLANAQRISEFLKDDYNWKMEKLYSETYAVTGLKTYSREVKIGFLFNEDLYLSAVKSNQGKEPDIQEKVSGKSAGDPKKDEPDKAGVEKVNNVDELRLFKLQDDTLSRAVYFPYVVRGPARLACDVGKVGQQAASNLTIQNCNNVNFGGPSQINNMRINS